jgi:AraC-like DNA-binding protein
MSALSTVMTSTTAKPGDGMETSIPPRRDLLGRSTDLQGARSWMADICGPHWLKVHSRNTLHFQHTGSVFRSMATTVGCVEYGVDVTVGLEDRNPLNCYSVSLPLVGEQELVVDGRRLNSDVSRGIIITPSGEQELTIAGNCRKVLVAITRSAMRNVLEEMLQRPLDKPLVFQPGMDAVNGATASWWRMVRHLWVEMETPHSLYHSVSMTSDIETALIKGLLLAQPHNYSDEMACNRLASSPAYLKKVRQFLMDNAREEISAEDIEKIAGISRFKLYEDFKRYFGVPPMAYLRQYRLKQARQEIASSGSPKYISGIALDWGFNHLGRFSSQYREFFGELPSETAQRFRYADPSKL